MYISLGLALRSTGSASYAIVHHLVESILTCFYCGAAVTWLIVSISDVPTSMEDAAVVFQILYREELLKNIVINPQSVQRLMLIKALSKMKPIYITVWDTLRVDKSLLLNSFGCTLTFGILIMQISVVDSR
ncbi:uncharacterized protein TNIN_264311 [Trichonephila inaurata madagascariensis]|uniref:Gustatory receptor n=1 Tax=Trichonephila inaurata madagascariensis TaxID=2747483 RepID=A0A8X6XMZ1_9ARAC|nr:uncharacterized protein TNIN_264311 [Trichonephila inaurata madagascariensis]